MSTNSLERVQAEFAADREATLLETWPERAIAACWAIGMLAVSALFVATMWWVTG